MAKQQHSSRFRKFLRSLRSGSISSTPSHNSSTSNVATSSNVFNKSLKLENILVEEYNFASNYAIQVLHDRRETVNLYILVIGIASSAIALIASNANAHVNLKIITSTVLIIFGFLNLFFFIHFVNIDRLYQDAIIRMKIIRDFYIEQFQDQVSDIINIFPSGLEFNSPDILRPTNHNVCFVYASVETICFVIVLFVSDDLWPRFNSGILLYARPYFLGVVCIVIVLLTHISYYRYVVNRPIIDKPLNNPGK